MTNRAPQCAASTKFTPMVCISFQTQENLGMTRSLLQENRKDKGVFGITKKPEKN